jgi:excisionase family DNA binding protein
MAEVDQGGEEYLTVADVAELLKLNQQTVRNWIDQGSMPAIRIGRRVRIKRTDLERVLARGYQGAEALQDSGLAGPSAADFWGGEQVGTAEPANGHPTAPPADLANGHPTAPPADLANSDAATAPSQPAADHTQVPPEEPANGHTTGPPSDRTDDEG